MNVTGSPVKLKRPNAMKATTARTIADCRTRRRMKASTSFQGSRSTTGAAADGSCRNPPGASIRGSLIQLRDAMTGDADAAKGLELRHVGRATGHGMRAARMERATGRRIEGRRQLSAERG